MKIAAWNLNHRIIEKKIPPEALRFFDAFSADLIVLNEFVDGESRASFRDELKKMGYDHQFVSEKRVKQNQVFIASKLPISLGDLKPPQQDDAAITNFLHITINGIDIEVVGIRAPAYNMARERKSYWQELASIIQSAANRRIVFLGDVNYDPFRKVAPSVTELRFDMAPAFTIPNPKGEWSYISLNEKARTRIDHAIVSDGLKVSNAEYLSTYNGITLAGGRRSSAVTDHAVLALNLAV